MLNPALCEKMEANDIDTGSLSLGIVHGWTRQPPLIREELEKNKLKNDRRAKEKS